MGSGRWPSETVGTEFRVGPMPGDGKAVARTVAVLAALLLSALALRGYLPADQGAAPPPREREPAQGSPIPVLVLFTVAVAILAFTALARPRRRPHTYAEEPPRRFGGTGGQIPWRLVIYVAAGFLIWLTLLLLLQRWDVPPPEPDSAPSDVAPTEPGTDSGGAEPEPPARGGSDSLFGYVLAATIAMVLLSIVAGFRGRPRGTAAQLPAADDVGPAPVRSGGPDLARAAELGLAEIGDRSRDPREAIIACYAAMETELEKSPSTSPQASDTPSEVLARAVARRVLRADNAAELVDLFEEARFSRHVMTEQHRDEALQALRAVQRELQGAS
ncbi:DUF4129 domain-containing protein [Mycobacterium sp. SMC-4]|uniref:DUF4129 domain-containing protein n=1 Tax=Mycobacterium sp. SMC-4 TaxID=2857059 RepID=UPI003D00F21C